MSPITPITPREIMWMCDAFGVCVSSIYRTFDVQFLRENLVKAEIAHLDKKGNLVQGKRASRRQKRGMPQTVTVTWKDGETQEETTVPLAMYGLGKKVGSETREGKREGGAPTDCWIAHQSVSHFHGIYCRLLSGLEISKPIELGSIDPLFLPSWSRGCTRAFGVCGLFFMGGMQGAMDYFQQHLHNDC